MLSPDYKDYGNNENKPKAIASNLMAKRREKLANARMTNSGLRSLQSS